MSPLDTHRHEKQDIMTILLLVDVIFVEQVRQETIRQARRLCVVTMRITAVRVGLLLLDLTLVLGIILMTGLHHIHQGVTGHRQVVTPTIAEVPHLIGTLATLHQVAVLEPLLGRRHVFEMNSRDPLGMSSSYESQHYIDVNICSDYPAPPDVRGRPASPRYDYPARTDSAEGPAPRYRYVRSP